MDTRRPKPLSQQPGAAKAAAPRPSPSLARRSGSRRSLPSDLTAAVHVEGSSCRPSCGRFILSGSAEVEPVVSPAVSQRWTAPNSCAVLVNGSRRGVLRAPVKSFSFGVLTFSPALSCPPSSSRSVHFTVLVRRVFVVEVFPR